MVRNKITETQYRDLQRAYDFFNEKLFGSKLPECLITLAGSPRCRGYYAPERFGEKGAAKGDLAELALNPLSFDRPEKEVLGTLVHEMCHCWQQELGKPSRGGYHNKEWAKQMAEVGLIASDTGAEGGKQTGQRMTHYIEEGGVFCKLADEFLEKFTIEFAAIPVMKEKAKKSKVKYTCDTCGFNAWAKPKANLMCGDCQEKMDGEDVEAA